MNHFLGDPAFSVDGATYTWGDVVLAAVQRGDWSRLEETLRRKLALLAEAEERGEAPTEEELDAAAQEFRYERDLITGEDMEAWLARAGISLDGWMDYIERSLVFSRSGEDARTKPAATEESSGEFDEELSAAMAAEATCSGALTRFAETLAARIAIGMRPLEGAGAESAGGGADQDLSAEKMHRAASSAAEAAALADGDAIRPGLAGRSARSGLAGLTGLAGERERARFEELARFENSFAARCRQLVSAGAVRSEIDSRRLDWIRLDLEALSFASEAAAREAALCVREDGASFASVADSAHVRVRRERLFAEELDPAARADLLSARPGEIVGPLAFAQEFHLFRLHGKTMPAEGDADVRGRSEAAVLDRLVDEETRSRIHWIERL